MHLSHRMIVGGGTVLAVLALTYGPVGATPQPHDPAAFAAVEGSFDRTSVREARRVDRVPTPHLDWVSCHDGAECATLRVPLDYDQSHGPTTTVAVARVKARDQGHRIGSLFVNPGGPGVPGITSALNASKRFGAAILDRFDIVGFDPRGVGESGPMHCFTSVAQQQAALGDLATTYPVTEPEERRYIESARDLAQACATSGQPLVSSMSTAEVARDLDVLRRAVGDTRLTFFGVSYGTVIGQYYANMFPDRVRSIAADGVVNPVNWVGTGNTAGTPIEDRLHTADGTYAALQEMFARCDRAGSARCSLAGHAERDFDTVVQRLKAAPLLVQDSQSGPQQLTYAGFIVLIQRCLTKPTGGTMIVELIRRILTETDEAAAAPATASDRASGDAAADTSGTPGTLPGYESPDASYSNNREAGAAVACTDALHPRRVDTWPALAAKADARAPHFGRLWVWTKVMCAGDVWSTRDEDAYRGPFNRRTVAPVLFVGNYWDPATNYDQAVSAAALLPNSRLLSSDSWGHTAYGTSSCVTAAVDAYLVRGDLPRANTVCMGDVQPFDA